MEKDWKICPQKWPGQKNNGKIKNSICAFIESLKEYEWWLYRKSQSRRLRNSEFSIIAPNCTGMFIYRDLWLPYLSPTINLTIEMNDFVRLVENFKWYMEKEIVELQGDYGYPAGMLGDIRINFVHYENFEKAIRKWNERKKRIKWDNLFLIGMERQGCTYETLLRFDKLPYKNKVIFTHLEYPEIKSAYYIKGFEGELEIGNLLEFKNQFLKRRYLNDFDYVSFLNVAV